MDRVMYCFGGFSLALLLGGLASACSPTSGTSVTSATEGSSSGGSNTGGTSGGAASGGIGPSLEPFWAKVSLTEANAGSSTLYLGSAQFHAGDGGDPFACSGTQVDDCCLVVPGPIPTLDQLSAGEVTFTANGAQIGQIQFLAGAGYQTITSANAGFHWSPGDTVGASAAGDAVGAFSGTVVAPPELSGLSPLPSPETLIVTAADGLTLAWNTGGPGAFHAVFVDGETNILTCDAPLTAGTLPVPTSLLAQLSGQGSYGLWPVNTSLVTGPNANIQLTANGIEALGSIAFQ